MADTPYEIENSYAFVRSALPDRCRDVLEVGCGGGELAARLAADGIAVVAVDSDAEAVAAARRRGVDARVAVWPTAMAGKFDAVLFTRSLHHIRPLAEAVEAARACLEPQGRVLVEDFALETVDARTVRWFTGMVRQLAASSQLAEGDALIDALLATDGSLEAWRADHDHDLHPAAAMREALQRRFTTVSLQQAPYMFRYAAAALGSGSRRNDILRALARQEQEFIADSAIAPVGWRFVGARH